MALKELTKKTDIKTLRIPVDKDTMENVELVQAQQRLKGNRMNQTETVIYILKKYREI